MNSKKPTLPPPVEARALRRGFTLIEMVISLTILALVVTILYLAFATAGRVWSRQQTDGGRGERESALARLLHDDFSSLVPYGYSGKNGIGFFFALGPKTLFYATTSGFGSRERVDGGLYFACLYLADGNLEEDTGGEAEKGDEAGQTLYLVKELGPKEYLLEALHRFITAPGDSFQPGEEFRQAVIPVLSGLEEASFAVVADPEKIAPGAAELESGALVDKANLRRFTRKTMPGLVLLQYRENGLWRRLLLAVPQPPPRPKKKRKGGLRMRKKE